jgi:hypothetical protein
MKLNSKLKLELWTRFELSCYVCLSLVCRGHLGESLQMNPFANRKLRTIFGISVHVFVLAAWVMAIVRPATACLSGQTTLSSIVGTWTGTSTCVGNRPACKNETVVYRFVPIEGHPGQLRQLADKIIDGKRVPMGALVFEYDRETKTLRSEFNRGQPTPSGRTP